MAQRSWPPLRITLSTEKNGVLLVLTVITNTAKEQNAVKTTTRRKHQYRQNKSPRKFLDKFADSISGVLSCFDRVIFKGHLPFGGSDYLNGFVDRVLQIRRKDFYQQLDGMSQQLVDHAQQMAQEAHAPYHYEQGKGSKEKRVEQIDRDRGHPEGLITVLCYQETCRTVKLRYGKGRPELEFAPRPQRVLYFYYNDPDFGRMYVRQQTWFPFTIQVYVNGHEWLARQMLHRQIGFTQVDNAFTALDDLDQPQRLADRFCQLRCRSQLNRWAKLVNCLLNRGWLRGKQYYWVIEQAEFSTDILFRTAQALGGLYRRMLDHAAVNFSAQDILTFLGRRLHGNFQGEVLTTCKKNRWPGARIKHCLKKNCLKMYEKFGYVLRIETVINQPREFKVRRWCERKGKRQLRWCPMNKGIANFHQYHAVSRAANVRYLEALSVVNDPAPAYSQVEQLVRTHHVGERTYAGFNPARTQDIRLFQAVLRGDHLVHGFRNRDIRSLLHGEASSAKQRRSQSVAVGRLLKRSVGGGVTTPLGTETWNY
jgi:hypothetical protein